MDEQREYCECGYRQSDYPEEDVSDITEEKQDV
jgi:hypothetical protein